MAEEVLEAVEKLQLRLNENQEPRKLLKTLKRLAELPITVEILVETGVGKTVNSLRKHDVAGDAAKNLVAKWKKLVPEKSTDRPSVNEGRSHSRINEPGGHKRVRERSPEERSPEDRSPAERSPEVRSPEVLSPEERSPAEPPLIEEDQEIEYQHGYSPSPPQHYRSPYAHARESDEYESPQEEEPKPSPPRNEVRRSKPHRESVREQSSQDVREQERRRNRDGNERKAHKADREQQGGTSHKSKHVRHLTSHEGRREKKGSSDGKSRERREVPVQVDEDEEHFEVPTMSFESFLTYDAPAPSKKKKKQPSRPAQPSPPAPSVSSKSSKANGTSSKRSEPSSSSLTMTTVPEKRRKVVDVVPTLPDISLPAIQPYYRPLPSIDLTPLSPPRRKVPVSYDEEDAGITGRRLNSKMVVYSGSKTAYLPKMMSLYDQCIRVLQNNIDSIDEVGGVPYDILKPVLERCTPEQLYRIEQCNQYFTEDSDDLWKKHCERDFKHDAPQEYESWREMYLRLHEEREERLRKLTMNISSAHANKPKGRQLKMAFVNSVAKPPRDVRRRQERSGIRNDSSSLSTASTSTTKIRPASSYSFQSKSTDGGQPSQSSPPETSSRSSALNTVGGQSARDKPQVKKIAPMMAKTIKAFKNRFSRR